MLFVDTDNALGSPRGDVDDAYALAALVKSGVEIAAISSVAGNTTEPLAYENTVRLCRLLGWRGPVLRATEARPVLHTFPGRIVALGPLTNVCTATAASEVIVVGATLHTLGRWPPVWPHEFNLTRDRAAALKVFESHLPLTFFPLDVVRKLWVRRRQLEPIAGALGEELRRETARWYRHLRLVRGTGRFPIYDLAAAMYAIDETGFTMEDTTAEMKRSTLVRFGRGTRPVRVCTRVDVGVVWGRFVRLVG
ncbi:MAG TPA: nucleoside hydrolase [Thermoanaerobaculia bacterium]|nr:nucleoside hydrolase [Thermoanaerobaculia bacterium]